MLANFFLAQWMLLPLGLLLVCIASVWLDAPQGGRVPAWVPLYAFTLVAVGCVMGASGVPRPGAFAALMLLPALAWWQRRPGLGPRWRRALKVLTVAVCFALALHAWPGFPDIVLLPDLRLGEDAAVFRLTAHLDAGVAGLFMLALYANRCATLEDWRGLLRSLAGPVVLTTVGVLALAVGLGYLRFDPKLPGVAWLYLLKTWFWTCVVEECFFRGILLEHLLRRGWRWGGIALTAVLFGLLHFKGGAELMLLASLAGMGYGWAYALTRKVEAAMAVHLVLNATHFFLFTYPRLQ